MKTTDIQHLSASRQPWESGFVGGTLKQSLPLAGGRQ